MHKSVLLIESINGLNIKPDGTYIDCTLGYAGHSGEILKRLETEGFYSPLIKMRKLLILVMISFLR